MWKIKHIFDGDYGCEESANDEPMVTVTLISDSEETRFVSVSDRWLIENNLDVGSIWPEN